MMRALLILLVLGLASAYYFTNKSSLDLEESMDNNNQESQELIKDKNLHQAFEKILENKTNKNRSPTSITAVKGDGLQEDKYSEESFEEDEFMSHASDPEQTFLTSGDYTDKFTNEMSSDEKIEAIKALSVEISNDHETLKGLKELGEDDKTINTFQERIMQKEYQLKYLSTLMTE
ncbi:MAG: hypothetical protein KBD76_15670 [Bacteriovorax sp.]|nr:hypothetical protein [Bacteriovorax sp.]